MKPSRKNIKRFRVPIYKYMLTNLNLRPQKSINSNVITVIPKNYKVQVIDSEDEWTKVSYESKEGHVYSDFLSVSQHPWSNLNLRAGKSTTSDSLAIIPKGARVEVLEVDRDWSKVVYNDQVCYVFNYYISNDGNPPGILDYTDFYTDMTKFVNKNNVKSTNNYLITTDLLNILIYLKETMAIGFNYISGNV